MITLSIMSSISLIIASKNTKIAQDYAEKLSKDNNIDVFDITIIEKETSIGVEDIRELKKQLFLKPIKSVEKTIIFSKAETMTIQAQNSILKILEEPPNNTNIILLVNSYDQLLPTVVSRCKTINLEEEKKEEEIEKYKKEFLEIAQFSLSKKLQKAQEISKNKEESLEWLKGMLKTAHLNINNKQDARTAMIALSLHNALKMTQTTNINLRFLLENLLLEM